MLVPDFRSWVAQRTLSPKPRWFAFVLLIAACSDDPTMTGEGGPPDGGSDLGEPDGRIGPVPAEMIAEIRAIALADDDGGRRVAINASQIEEWVAYANDVYAGSKIGFTFDGTIDLADDTVLNSAYGNEDPAWLDVLARGDALAAEEPGSITVLFRYGPGPPPTGQGFSWTDYDFVVAPGFAATLVCGRQNIELFAHELGHQLGLAHTFGTIYDTIAEAADAFEGDTNLFDGDGIEDTLPDPFVSDVQCAGEVELDGVSFELPRDNVMGYWSPIGIKTTSAIQGAIARQGLALRTGRGPSELIEGEAQAFEAELLDTQTGGGTLSSQDMTPFLGRWSNDMHVLWIDAARAERLDVRFSIAEGGEHDLFIGATRAPDFGIHQHLVNGDSIGDPVDLYARSVQPSGPIHLGRAGLVAGENVVTVSAEGENPAAVPRRGYGLDYLLVVRAD